jgi:hypothetical protein
LLSLQVRAGHPDFLDLPWHLPLAEWEGRCPRLVRVQRGLSRHEVLFAGYGEAIYALKEMPPGAAEREYAMLRALEERDLPAVSAVGLASCRAGGEESDVLLTRFLEASLPYLTLFSQTGLERYRERLLDAMAGLLVRLHVGGAYWGDCSLSNTLFRRDAGALQAWLVDAETSEVHASLSDGLRSQDLLLMEENVEGELADLAAVVELPRPLAREGTGEEIRRRYERLWSETTREEVIAPSESYRIHERIRALNELGFTVGEVTLVATGEGDRLRMRPVVTDRDYHRRTLHGLTGIEAGDRQAKLLLNEIRELRATLSLEQGAGVPLNVAATRWLEDRFQPAVQRLSSLAAAGTDVSELYCQVLEHKWFLSERARHDVGLDRAMEDYLSRFRRSEAASPAEEDPAAP